MALFPMSLFRAANVFDVVLMLVGSVAAIVNGLALPAILVVGSLVYDEYGRSQPSTTQPKDFAKRYLCIAAVAMVAAYLNVSCWTCTADRQIQKLRLLYMTSLLDQSVSDVDDSTANVINNVTTNLSLIQQVIGEKIGNIIYSLSFFIGGCLVSVVLIWRLSIVLLSCVPLLLLPSILYAGIAKACSERKLSAQTEAGAIVKQTISNIRVAKAFTSETRTLASYSASLEKAAAVERFESLAKGVTVGLNGISLLIWALMVWYGSKLVADNHGTGAQILLVGVGFMISSMQLQTAINETKGVIDGRAAIKNLLQVIEHVPPTKNTAGLTMKTVEGYICFRSVSFSYPTRPTQLALENFTLDVPAGQITALVGKSGSGKSTAIALIEQFYHPTAGEITLDGISIRNLELNWLRRRIGLVSQEPTLLSTSIRQNILFGNETASMADVIAAAKQANAHDFIEKLPRGYETQVGELGIAISGGQKQRIAIARAIIRKPSIMLLDEATSALDNESERAVQQALDEACKDVTTITISHRLNSVRNAHNIAIVQGGKVIESGRQQELLQKQDGIYANIVAEMNRDTAIAIEPKHRLKNICISEERKKTEKTIVPSPRPKHSSVQAMPRRCSFMQILSFNRSEWKHACMTVLSAMLIGFIVPGSGVLNAVTIAAFYRQNAQEMKHTVRFACGLYVFAAVALFAAYYNLNYRAGITSAALTWRIRRAMLARILQQEVAWFDREGNSSGQIYNRLGNDAKMVAELVWDRGPSLIQVASTITFCMILSFCLSWKISLVASIAQPVIVAAIFARTISIAKLARDVADEHKRVSHLANDAASQYKTIAAYCLQKTILNDFRSRSSRSTTLLTASQVAAIFHGISFFAVYNFYALCIWYGGNLLARKRISFQSFVVCYSALVAAGRALAETAAAAPAIAHGLTAKVSVLEILEMPTTMNNTTLGTIDVEKIKTGPGDDDDDDDDYTILGNVEFQNVSFAYLELPVLKNFSFEVAAGQTAALVGRSGTGKSTVIALLERFYEPASGRILLDGRDITSFSVEKLRKQLALVSQEPTLFAMSIRDNIAYGLDIVTDAEIVEAATIANAHAFISGLPRGYDTNAGEGGVLLSGGQKQRIAIARAVIRKPSILLLDEATSALDGESELAVQQALDKATSSSSTATTTIIVVAHRLSTIRHADRIAVMADGGIVEQGKHHDLLARNGHYLALIQSQL